MKDKEKLEQVGELDKKEGLESIEEKEKIALVLGKEVEGKDIPSSYSSWINSSRSAGCCRDSRFVYGESLKDIIGAILVDYSYYPGGGCGIEYGVKIFVKRGSKTDMKRIVYRDAYSSRGDDRSKAYRKIDKVKIMDDEIIISVSSSQRTDTYTFGLQKQKEEISEKCLSTAEQEKFKERITKEKERLLQENTRRYGIMPSNYDLVYMQMPGSKIYNRTYEEAKIIDESINLGEGICYIVIKTQIDANAANGMQFAWLKYEITPTSTKLVGQQTAYQSELMSGKRINVRAK